MRYSMALAVSLLFAWGLSAQTTVDSISYDKGMEWKVYETDGACVRFAVAGGEVWRATATKVSRVNAKSSKYREYPMLGKISASGVTAMATDASGRVWIGTGEGVALYSKGKFTSFNEQKGLCNNKVQVIYATPGGAVWVGTAKGVCVYQGGSWTAYTKENGLRGDIVKTIATDHRGALWFGTNNGISVMKGSQWESHSMDNGLSWNDTKALAFDARKKKMWAAVGDEDVCCYDGKEWKVYMAVQQGIGWIMVDTQSRVWFGSSEGLLKFNGDEWITDQQRIGIPAKLVSQMKRDGAGNLWFASENGVVFLKNPYPF